MPASSPADATAPGGSGLGRFARPPPKESFAAYSSPTASRQSSGLSCMSSPLAPHDFAHRVPLADSNHENNSSNNNDRVLAVARDLVRKHRPEYADCVGMSDSEKDQQLRHHMSFVSKCVQIQSWLCCCRPHCVQVLIV